MRLTVAEREVRRQEACCRWRRVTEQVYSSETRVDMDRVIFFIKSNIVSIRKIRTNLRLFNVLYHTQRGPFQAAVRVENFQKITIFISIFGKSVTKESRK